MSAPDLHRQMLRMLDGELSAAEAAALEAELQNSPEARQAWRSLARVHSALEVRYRSAANVAKMPIVPVDRILARQRRKMVKVSLLAAAAVLLLSALIFHFKMVQTEAPVARFQVGPDTAFTLTHTDDDKAPMGKVLAAGSRLRLTRGTMEGVFDSGVRCVIEAPCDLTVLDDDRIAVTQGVAWFEVPPAAVGFTVETSQLNVVDLGTAFGVVARAGEEHEVHVTKGSVEMRAGGAGDHDVTLVLPAGQARRADDSGGFVSIPVQAGKFTTALPEVVSIANHSFEVDRNPHPQGDQVYGERRDFPGGELTGWIQQTPPATGVPDGAGVTVGWMDLEPSSLHPFPPAAGRPSQALSLQSGASVLNRTGTRWSSLRAGEKLTLTVALGERDYSILDWNEETFFGLTDDAADLSTVEPSDTVANSGIIRTNPATGNRSGNGMLVDVSFVHTVTKADLKRPGRIGILIVSQATGARGRIENQAKFDNVRLTRTPPSPVPEH